MTAGRLRLRVALLLLVGTSCLFIAISRGVFLYGDDILMFEVTESMVRRGDVTVVASYDIDDIAKGTPGYDGRNFAKYGIGQSLVAIPTYLFAWLILDPIVNTPEAVDPFGHLRRGVLVYGTGLVNAVIGGAVVALCYLTALVLGYSLRTSLVLAALLVTGTLLPHYAATFMSEPLVALTLIATFYGLLRVRQLGAEQWNSTRADDSPIRGAAHPLACTGAPRWHQRAPSGPASYLASSSDETISVAMSSGHAAWGRRYQDMKTECSVACPTAYRYPEITKDPMARRMASLRSTRSFASLRMTARLGTHDRATAPVHQGVQGSSARHLTLGQVLPGPSVRCLATFDMTDEKDEVAGDTGGDDVGRAKVHPYDAWLWLALSGFAAGLALATRLAIGVALVPIGLWFLWIVWTRWRTSWRGALLAVLAWGLPIAAWLGVVGAYNWYRFRDVRSTGYREEAGAFETPLLEGVYGLLLSPGRGVIWYNPPLILGIVGFFLLWRRQRAVTLVLAGMALATVFFYARYYQWYGGGVWGPRFLVPLLPLLLLPAGEIVERAWRTRRLAATVIVAGLLGAFVTALGILVPFDTYVIEISSTPGMLEDSFWRASDSPLVVHLRRINFANLTPDVAAQRYGSARLALVSLLALIAGLVAWAYAALLTRRNETAS